MVALVGVAALLIPVVCLAAFAVASLRWGVDTRQDPQDMCRPGRRTGVS